MNAFGVPDRQFGFLITDPCVGRLDMTAQAGPVDGPSDELTAVIGGQIARFGTWALLALIATIIFILVVKPLG